MFRVNRMLALGSLVAIAATTLVGHPGEDAVANSACQGPAVGEEPDWGNEDPRLITSAEDLIYLSLKANDHTFVDPNLVSSTFLNANYRLTTNIDLGDCLWDPIGDQATTGSPNNLNGSETNRYFTGSFDGGGYSISGLNVTSTDEYVGFFGTVRGGTYNGVSFTPTIQNLSLSGTVTASRTSTSGDVGGLIGWIGENVNVEDVSISVDVTAPNSYRHEVGGLAGQVGEEGVVITRSSSSGLVSATESNVGGLIGLVTRSSTIVSYSFASGSVSVVRDPGEEPGRAGGLIGYNQGAIRDSYAFGSVTATNATSGQPIVGGLVGTSRDGSGAIERVHARGLVSGDGTNGGLIGTLEGNSPPTVSDSFWDSDSTGLATSAGSLATAKTTVEMTSFATFSDTATDGLTNAWNIVEGWQAFDSSAGKVWGICAEVNDGYPFLLWEYDADPCGASGGGTASAPKSRPTGSPGIFLTVTGNPGDQVAGRQVVFGSYAVSSRSPYALTVQPSATPGEQVILASGFTNPGGHLEREIVLPRLSPGSHTIVFVGRGATGELLALRNVVVVDANGRLSSITPEALQPRLR